MANYLLKTHATQDVIAEAQAEILNFKYPARMSTLQYSEVLPEKALLCDRIYEELVLKRIFIWSLTFVYSLLFANLLGSRPRSYVT